MIKSLRYSRWLFKLHVTKLSKEEDEIARLISSAEFLIEDILAPLYEQGKIISEKQLSSNILKALDSTRKKITKEFEAKYGKAKKNPAGSLRDQKIAKQIAKSYRDRIDQKTDNYKKDDSILSPKKQAIQDMMNSYKVIASTEASRVVNEQREFLLGSYPGTKTWNAVLDYKTCLVCKKLNGKTISTSADFKEQPPIHPNCRCFIEYKLKEVKGK